MARQYDPELIDLDLVDVGFRRRFPADKLAQPLQIAEWFALGCAPDEIAAALRLRLGQVNRVLGFAINLSARCDPAGRTGPKVAEFRALSLRIQNAFAAEGISTREAARAIFDEDFQLIRKIPRLGSKSEARIARWLGYEPQPGGTRGIERRLGRAIALLHLHGYEVTKRPPAMDARAHPNGGPTRETSIGGEHHDAPELRHPTEHLERTC